MFKIQTEFRPTIAAVVKAERERREQRRAEELKSWKRLFEETKKEVESSSKFQQ